MSRAIQLVRGLTVAGAAMLALKLCGMVWAGQRPDYPRPEPDCCNANTRNWGYVETKWRQWPGAKNISQTNPRAIGAQVIPTPEAREILPLPKVPVPQRETLPILPPPEGGILPPESLPIPESKPEAPIEPKFEPKPEPKAEAPADGGLPGLPVEPEQSVLPVPSGVEPQPPAIPKERPKAESEPTKKDKGASLPMRGQSAQESWRKGLEPPTGMMERLASPPAEPPPATKPAPIQLIVAGGNEPEGVATATDANLADAIATTAPRQNALTQTAYEMPSAPTAAAEGTSVHLPTVALGGYCPVELLQNGQWIRGDLRWTVVHNGRIYRFSGAEQRQQFLADPQSFAPANFGMDPVLSLEEHRGVEGQVTYCATYNGRLYMFSSAATQSKFNLQPERYAK